MKRARKSNERAAKHNIEAMAMATAIPIATMTTLAHRLPALAATTADGKAWQDPEVQRMVAEKVQTGFLTMAAFGEMAVATQRAFAGYAVDQVRTNLKMAAKTGAPERQIADYASESGVHLARLFAALGEIGSRSAVGSLGPAHKKVTANARRLGKRHAGPAR